MACVSSFNSNDENSQNLLSKFFCAPYPEGLSAES